MLRLNLKLLRVNLRQGFLSSQDFVATSSKMSSAFICWWRSNAIRDFNLVAAVQNVVLLQGFCQPACLGLFGFLIQN
jgi:hypothetical protein